MFDLDGTLASARWREPFILDDAFAPDWSAYFQHLVHDTPIIDVVDQVKSAHEQGHAIVLLTSRRDDLREATEFWLLANGIRHDELIMRPFHDERVDTEVKRDLYETQVHGRFQVVAAYDDQPRIIEMWKSVGVEGHLVSDPDCNPAVSRRVALEWHRGHNQGTAMGFGP